MTDFDIGFVIFPDITQLDFTGPFEVLSRLGTPPSLLAASKFSESENSRCREDPVTSLERPRPQDHADLHL